MINLLLNNNDNSLNHTDLYTLFKKIQKHPLGARHQILDISHDTLRVSLY